VLFSTALIICKIHNLKPNEIDILKLPKMLYLLLFKGLQGEPGPTGSMGTPGLKGEVRTNHKFYPHLNKISLPYNLKPHSKIHLSQNHAVKVPP
jgi:hypothetical protein